MHNLTEKYFPEVNFGGFTRVDGTVAFYTRVQSLLTPQITVLDCGCGRSCYQPGSAPIRDRLRTLSGDGRKIIGIDVDPMGETNQTIDEFRLINSVKEPWPLRDEEVDFIVSDYVLEHVSEVSLFFEEANRVLKPGGYFCLRTINVISFFGMMSTIMRGPIRKTVLKRAQDAREEEDMFPVVNACNTKRKVEQAYHKSGFDAVVVHNQAEPTYAYGNSFLYCLMEWERRLAPSWFQDNLFGYGRKR